ncbi:MAG: response regulator [Anaerolineales bacterium]|nr:response regulator [Anaerolineales bacterium]MCX7755210.1 response regulator [Anaerolineales bacterium]MDW8277483.1 response regulator [Anaerolineales bacterium]
MQPYLLVLEDDPILGKVAIEAARQVGMLALLDSDGDKYRALLAEHGIPQAVLLDLHLPFASGADLLREFRADARFAEVPILIVTADILQARALQEQGERVLLKPVSMMRLQEILSQIQG